MVMSGEPSKEDLNNCIDPLKDELKQLYSGEYIHSNHPISLITSFKGLIMKVYERRLPQRVHAATLFDASDVPASRKLQGAAGHSHRKHPVVSATLLSTKSIPKKAMMPQVVKLLFIDFI